MSSIVQVYQQRIISLQSDIANNAEVIDQCLEVKLGEHDDVQDTTVNINNAITTQHHLLVELSINISHLEKARMLVNTLFGDITEMSDEKQGFLMRLLEWHVAGENLHKHNPDSPTESFTEYLTDLLYSTHYIEVLHANETNALGPWFDDMLNLWRDALRLCPDAANFVEETI